MGNNSLRRPKNSDDVSLKNGTITEPGDPQPLQPPNPQPLQPPKVAPPPCTQLKFATQ